MANNGRNYKCDHYRWKQHPSYTCDYTGEEMEGEWYQESCCVDISLGAFKCTKCGEIGYYTGQWKAYYTGGTPCPGSDYVDRELK